jgi:Ca-activated chloride channel family protein
MTPPQRLALVALAACAASHPRPAPPIHHEPPPPAQPLVIPQDPGLVELSADPSTKLVLASTRTEMGVRFRIVGKAPADLPRPQLNLGLVLDTSGSMEGKSIEAVRGSARELVGKLHDGDRISIVTFDSTAHLLVPNVALGPTNREHILGLIDGLVPRGTTALYEGLALGYSQLLSNRLPQGINRLVLLSDGVPNSSANLPALIAQIHGYGISVTSLGLGIDYDTRLMTQIARDTGGSFTYVDKPEKVEQVFDDELARMTTIVGRNLQLAIEPGPGVTIEPMPSISPAGDGKFYIQVGDLSAGETRDIMVPVAVSARGDGSTVELASATLGFDDMIARSGHHERDAYVGIRAASDAAAVRASVVPELESLRIHTRAAAVILDAMNLARIGNTAEAHKRLDEMIGQVRAANARMHDPDLDKLLDQLLATSKQIAQIVKPTPTVDKIAVPEPAVAPPTVESGLRKTEESAQDTIEGIAPRTR